MTLAARATLAPPPLPPRRPGSDWPHVLCPAPGCMPPAVANGPLERILHVSNASHIDRQAGLTRAFESICSAYRRVEWLRLNMTETAAAMLEEAAAIRPTLVWLQLQHEGIVEPETIHALRALCDPSVVIVNWDGDQHFEPQDRRRRWFVELGHACDASLVVNTKHPAEYRELGVRHPGFLGCGLDETVWRPVTEQLDGVPAIVCLANYWPQARVAYDHRTSLLHQVALAYPDRFAVYGRGWEDYRALPSRPFLPNELEAYVYGAARAALSISIRCDLPRYTSNRLLYALASGAVVLVERFPDCEGLGLENGANCLLWSDFGELLGLLQYLLNTTPAFQGGLAQGLVNLRAAAAALGRKHSWTAHMAELRAIVAAVREART